MDQHTSDMEQYVVYYNPSDYPKKFVVRGIVVTPDGFIRMRHKASVHDTLEEARSSVPQGYLCIPPHQDDDPVIVETWI